MATTTNEGQAADPGAWASSTTADPPTACPECGETAFIQDARRGEVVCAHCGLVISENAIDPGPEWRAFDASQRADRARTGPGRTIMRHDHGLGTEIGYSRAANPEIRQRLHRFRRHQQRATYKPGADRGLARALSEIDRLSKGLGLPDAVAQTAAQIYRQARKADFLQGRSLEATAAASVYAASRIHQTPRQLEEVTELAHSESRELARTYRKLIKELELAVPIMTPMDLLPAAASRIEASAAVRRRAAQIVEHADPSTVTGKNPASIVAAALYLAGVENGEHKTQDEVAEAAGVTAVTLRARLKDLDPPPAA